MKFMVWCPVMKGVIAVGTVRKRHGVKLKSDVALEALKGDQTINEIASKFKIHPTQVSQWKKQLQEGLAGVFGARRTQSEASETLVGQLYEEIGRLKFELDWLKKKATRLS
jgi:transposase-like protein